MFDSIGQTHKFEVKVIAYNFRATRQTVIVSKIVEPAELPQLASQNLIPAIAKEKHQQYLAAGESSTISSNKNSRPGDTKSSETNQSNKPILVETKTIDDNMKTKATADETASDTDKNSKITLEERKTTKSTKNNKPEATVTKTKCARCNT